MVSGLFQGPLRGKKFVAICADTGVLCSGTAEVSLMDYVPEQRVAEVQSGGGG